MASAERCASPNQKRRLNVEHTDFPQSCSDNSESNSDDELSPKNEALSDTETAEKEIPESRFPSTETKQTKKKDVLIAPPPSKANTKAGQGDISGTKAARSTPPLKQESNKQRIKVGYDGSGTQKVTESSHPYVPEFLREYGPYLIAVAVVIVACILVILRQQLQIESSPLKKDVQDIDIFLEQMEKAKTQFPNQRVELWTRSKIHLRKHLQTARPTEPVSLILTAGLNAQKTLHCLAKAVASAFSATHNKSILHIDGATVASQDSDRVKLDIDSKLQGAFEGNVSVAVIHRFDALPPGSTLIFYRYCDHENAAYKKTFLIFTVLLGEEEVPAELRLSAVEEMVDDHLQSKFLTHKDPVSFDKMDRDKYSGLWSRISHVILPVAAEERVEHHGCEMT